jgi:hypothetical protein
MQEGTILKNLARGTSERRGNIKIGNSGDDLSEDRYGALVCDPCAIQMLVESQ